MSGNLKDFATGIVVTAPYPATSGTSLTLQTGEGARMPSVPFYATAHPATEYPTLDSAEKILVTAIEDDTITFTRAQGDTTAKSIAAGWRISNALFESNIPDDVSITGEDYVSVTDNVITANPIDLDNLSATGTPSVNNFLRGDNTWAEITAGSGGYAANVYMSNTANSIVGSYKNLSYSNDVATSEYSQTVTATETLMYTYLFGAAVGTTIVDAGVWLARFNAKLSSTAGSSYIKMTVFKRSSGGIETDLFSMQTEDINSTSYSNAEMSSYQSDYTLLTTDILGCRVYAGTNSAAPITVYYRVGNGTPSYINTPLAIRHTQLRGLNDDTSNVHVSSTEKSAITHTNRTALDAVTGTNTGDQTDATLTFSDITTNNVSTSKHGFAPKAPNDTTKFLRGDGTWAEAIGSNTFIPNEVPTGATDGNGDRLYITAYPYISGTTELYLNGVRQKLGTHYTEDNAASGYLRILAADILPGTVDVIVSYQKVISTTGNADTLDGFHANSTPTASNIPVLDSNSRITAERKFSGAKVYNSTTQTIPTSAITVLTFDTETFDTDSYHSTSSNTGRFTITTAGYYLLVGHAIFSTASGIVNTWFQLNGVSGSRYGFNGCNNSTTNNTGPCSSDIIYLNAGDYVEMVAFQNSGGNITAIHSTTGNTTFAITRIGA